MKQLLILFCFLSLSTTTNANASNKPQVNKNTQIVVSYGCKRPTWTSKKYQVVVEGQAMICYMNTRNHLLYETSIVAPQIEVKTSTNKKGKTKTRCKVLSGQWKVFDGTNDIIETDPAKLQIDHILPFSYIRLNMKDCKLAKKYFNYVDNLAVAYGAVNLKKSDNLCENQQECEQQKTICRKMSIEFDDEKLCEELENKEI